MPLFGLCRSSSNKCFQNYGKFGQTSMTEFIFYNVMDLIYNFTSKEPLCASFTKNSVKYPEQVYLRKPLFFNLKTVLLDFLIKCDKKRVSENGVVHRIYLKECGFSVCWFYCFFLSFAAAANQAPIPFVRPTIHPVGMFSFCILTHFSSMLHFYRNQFIYLNCKLNDLFLYGMQHWAEMR